MRHLIKSNGRIIFHTTNMISSSFSWNQQNHTYKKKKNNKLANFLWIGFLFFLVYSIFTDIVNHHIAFIVMFSSYASIVIIIIHVVLPLLNHYNISHSLRSFRCHFDQHCNSFFCLLLTASNVIVRFFQNFWWELFQIQSNIV